MSSTDKTKFNITETSKQANVDITSDKVELAADSSDHTLVAIVPSNANCTSGVTVEVEMSPDGVNWCPALRKETVTTPGSTTAEIIGNEKYVDLQKNAPVYNSYAKGGLNFDINGNEVSLGTGVRDLMDQHIAVNKSFNYSMWIKSNTLPTSTYKPVLFRHGGYDTFENTKIVELTDEDPSSTPIENKFQNGAVFRKGAIGTTFNELYYNSTSSWTHAFWVKGKGANTTWGVDGAWAQWFTNYVRVSGGLTFDYNSQRLYWYIQGAGFDTSSILYSGGVTGSSTLHPGETNDDFCSQWFLCVVTHDYNSGTGTQTLTQYMYTEDGRSWAGGTAGPYTRTSTAVTYNGRTIDGIGHGQGDVCQYFIWDKALSSSEVSDLLRTSPLGGNYKSPEDPTSLSSSSNLIGWYTFGDDSSDTSSVIKNIAPGSSIPDLWTSGNTYVSIANTEPVYMGGTVKATQNLCEPNTLPFATIFTSTSNLSISGWFKTTDTGTLFSNGPLASLAGLSLDITSSTNIDLKLGTATPTSITSSVNLHDGDWHHLLLTKSNSGVYTVYVDSVSMGTVTDASTDPKGSYGFTLLGDGQNNANAASPGTTDASKLQASLSNWSLHSEVLDQYAISQLYSNGHVRNIKNLPSVTVGTPGTAPAIEAWWQLNDTTSPEQDLVGSNDLILAQPVLGNEKALQTASSTTSSTRDFISTTASSLFGGTSLPAYNGAWSLSFWVNIPSNGTGSQFDTIIGEADSAETRKHFKIYQLSGALAFSMAFVNNALDLTVPFTTYNTWKHVTITKASGTPSTTTIKIYIDGVAQTVSVGYNDDSPARGTADNWNTTNDSTITIGGHSWAYNSVSSGVYAGVRSGRAFKVDSLAGYSKELSSSEVSYVYNSGNYIDLSTIASSYNVESYFKFGDYSNDVITGTIALHDGVGGVGVLGIGTSSNQSIISLTSSDPQFQSNTILAALNTHLVNATGDTLVEKSINGNAITLSITKNFDFVNEVWVSNASGDTAFCLSLNGFEEQAEYFALWKCSQTLPDGVVNVCDGNWHNIALSYRGQNDLAGDNVAEGDAARFGRGSADNPFNFSLAIDGYPLYTEISNNTGADYIGGNNALLTDTINSVTYNVGFNIYNRHLKYDPNNNNEQYRVHGQFGSGVHTYLTNETDPHSFRGEVDETSFHTDPWWSNADGTNIDLFGADTSKRGNLFNQEKTYTLYGRTTALANRGTNATYPEGVPYPLLNPELLVNSGNITDIEGTNQFINPVRKGDTQSWDSQASAGGLEGWWRWGDTPGDCSITVNDVKDHNSTPAVDYRDIQAVYLTDQGASSNVVIATNETIYLQSQAASTTPGSAGIQYNQIKLEDLSTLIGTATCAVKDFVSPVLQYLRIKLTGSGTCDIGDGKLEIEVNHKKRRMK